MALGSPIVWIHCSIDVLSANKVCSCIFAMMEKAAHQNIPPPLPPLLGSAMQADLSDSPSTPGCAGVARANNERAACIKRDLVQTQKRPTRAKQ